MTASGESLFDLHGRTAVVTGGAGILGRRLCRGLAEFGARVAVIDVDGAAAEATAAELTAGQGAAAIGVACDVADPDSVAAMAGRVAGDLGEVGILVNGAATKTADPGRFLAPFEEYDLETWRAVMAVNLDGMFLVAQELGRRMIAAGINGSIIQISSIYGLVAPDQRLYEGSEYEGRPISSPAVYAVSKAAAIGLSKYLASYWGAAGIRVNTLVPGGVESGQNKTFQDAYGAKTPLGRMARRDEMVGAVVFLASDAASYVTGQTLAVDGGWTIW